MNKTTKLLATSIALASLPATAANYAIEARGDAMGGVGVVSANFLTAPFYNPALVAIYRRNDDLGMITPSFGVNYNDPNNLVDDVDSLVDKISDGSVTNSDIAALDGDKLKVDIGGVVAFALPNQYVAANIFGKAYTESFVTPDTYTGNANDVVNAELTAVKAVSIGIAEAGISLAKYQTFLGQHFSFGVSPKLQRIYTYNYIASASNYDLSDVRENETAETTFNIDAGALWFYGPFRVGFSATNIIDRDIDTKAVTQTITSTTNPGASRVVTSNHSYKLGPVYTVGAGVVADYFTLSVDYDINEAEKFTSFDDNEQMIRVGTEVDILRQLKLRGGYYKNLAYSDSEGTVTAGIGLSPLNLFQLDISANYTNENAMGASINFLASY
ncbi:conjugal transfer protein TraF [Vibrio fortis]|uniref:Conjugal transfer protein TraF n=1 Tax=Vibrio fortis TaxID=212667 RepID=A0A5N3S3K9_9VIBR|nr:conjugal transfer protein TraF [Vibrio fortis]KAB0289267.1 conjugal transfer protein TraF [Vibrio fortis]KAB0300655.1 conjugal transfer protein TraF [Vibrio fortis]